MPSRYETRQDMKRQSFTRGQLSTRKNIAEADPDLGAEQAAYRARFKTRNTKRDIIITDVNGNY